MPRGSFDLRSKALGDALTAKAIALARQGKSAPEIASALGCHRQSVREALKSFGIRAIEARAHRFTPTMRTVLKAIAVNPNLPMKARTVRGLVEEGYIEASLEVPRSYTLTAKGLAAIQ